MTWFKVDDSLHSHVKAMRAGEAALGLWTLAGSWCAQHLTDGWIPAYAAMRLSPRAEELAAELVRAGLWSPVERDGETGWQFHAWSDYQPTRDNVEARRRSDADRRARWRQTQTTTSTAASQAESQSESRRDAPRESWQASRPESRGRARHPDPTRPVPDTSTDVSPSCSPPDRFAEFWAVYPLKKSKKAARKSWDRALKDTDADTLITAAGRYAAECAASGTSYVKHPTTWLNQGCWDDEPTPVRATPPPSMSTRDQRVAETQALKARMRGDNAPDCEDRQLRAITGGRGA